jgi:hypothetical protein
MTADALAEWVRPIAETLAEDRRRVVDFARSATPEFWSRRSVVEGWTNKDILAHLAGGNDLLVQTLLRSLTADDWSDPGVLAPDTDAENARRVAERRSWSIGQLIAELERDIDEILGWLRQLDDGHQHVRPDGLGMTVGEFFRLVHQERHDRVHMEQLQQR